MQARRTVTTFLILSHIFPILSSEQPKIAFLCKVRGFSENSVYGLHTKMIKLVFPFPNMENVPLFCYVMTTILSYICIVKFSLYVGRSKTGKNYDEGARSKNNNNSQHTEVVDFLCPGFYVKFKK